MRKTMTGFNLLLLALALAMSGRVQADDKDPYPNMAPLAQYLPASQADEIAAARTAAPASISDKAEILVLGAHGYETAVKGTNGFVCFVGRSWGQDFDAPEFWNPKIHTPQCFNAAAASSVLPDYLKRTKWALAGVTLKEMAARTKAAWTTHEFRPPAPESVAFMMSKDQYINDPQEGAEPRWYPHVMFFMPATDEGKWGSNIHGSPIFSNTSDAEPITTFFVVAPKWSDGSLGPYVAAPAAATGKPESHHHG